MGKEKETKKAPAKKTTKKTDTNEAPLIKEEKAVEAKDLYTRQFIARIETLIGEFLEEFQIDQNLTGIDRRWLTGAGVRNNGFIGILTKTRRKKSIAQRQKGTEAARCLKAARTLFHKFRCNQEKARMKRRQRSWRELSKRNSVPPRLCVFFFCS